MSELALDNPSGEVCLHMNSESRKGWEAVLDKEVGGNWRDHTIFNPLYDIKEDGTRGYYWEMRIDDLPIST